MKDCECILSYYYHKDQSNIYTIQIDIPYRNSTITTHINKYELPAMNWTVYFGHVIAGKRHVISFWKMYNIWTKILPLWHPMIQSMRKIGVELVFDSVPEDPKQKGG